MGIGHFRVRLCPREKRFIWRWIWFAWNWTYKETQFHMNYFAWSLVLTPRQKSKIAYLKSKIPRGALSYTVSESNWNLEVFVYYSRASNFERVIFMRRCRKKIFFNFFLSDVVTLLRCRRAASWLDSALNLTAEEEIWVNLLMTSQKRLDYAWEWWEKNTIFITISDMHSRNQLRKSSNVF